VRSRAVTMGQIADILQSRGDLDGALQIHKDQLPVYERLGDVRERAVTMGKIADILQSRGDLDGALRIRREEQLPIFERLGDARERAAVQPAAATGEPAWVHRLLPFAWMDRSGRDSSCLFHEKLQAGGRLWRRSLIRCGGISFAAALAACTIEDHFDGAWLRSVFSEKFGVVLSGSFCC